MNSNTINDNMVDYIRGKEKGVSSLELAESFLKFTRPDNRMAHIAVSGILQREKRCFLGSDGLWYIEQKYDSKTQQQICTQPWAAVHILMGPAGGAEKAMHISIWSPFQTQECLLSEWLINPLSLSYEEREAMMSGYDRAFDSTDATFSRVVKILDKRIAVFLSSQQQRLLYRYSGNMGEFLSDDTLLLSHLFRVVGIDIPKPIELIPCFKLLFDRDPITSSACHYGEALSECVRELILRLSDMNITTREDLDVYEQKEILTRKWENAVFSMSDIAALPQSSGVYGFKNRKGEYIYIGKAKNLRRRLMSYFRDTEESPEKIEKLRLEAYELKTYECGSELESLLYEHRLIKKYQPFYNLKIDINERKGLYTPLQDCIILLPHTEKGKGMSFWFRQNQKVLIKPFNVDFRESEGLLEQLAEFFFKEKLPADYTDFPEQEIVFRWVKSKKESLSIVPVYRMGSAEEIFEAMRGYWKDAPAGIGR